MSYVKMENWLRIFGRFFKNENKKIFLIIFLFFSQWKETRVVWRLTLIQRMRFCEVSGAELYVNQKQETGLFVAIDRKADDYPGCPLSSVTVKWTGRQFVPYLNVSSIKTASDFHYLSMACCNLVAARQIGAEVTKLRSYFIGNNPINYFVASWKKAA